MQRVHFEVRVGVFCCQDKYLSLCLWYCGKKQIDRMWFSVVYSCRQRYVSSQWSKCFPTNRAFPSSLVPLFQNESKCNTFHLKMSSACSFIFMQIKVILMSMVLHLDSLWDRGTRELRNGLLSNITKHALWFSYVISRDVYWSKEIPCSFASVFPWVMHTPFTGHY